MKKCHWFSGILRIFFDRNSTLNISPTMNNTNSYCLGSEHISQWSLSVVFINVQCAHVQLEPIGGNGAAFGPT